MRWVFHSSYVGLDRRLRRLWLRLFERRRESHVGPPPPLATALRQLKLAALDVRDPASRPKFSRQVHSVSLLALSHGHKEAADLLARLHERLERSEGKTSEATLATIHSHLLQLEALVG